MSLWLTLKKLFPEISCDYEIEDQFEDAQCWREAKAKRKHDLADQYNESSDYEYETQPDEIREDKEDE